jgi:hypothetical protein
VGIPITAQDYRKITSNPCLRKTRLSAKGSAL